MSLTPDITVFWGKTSQNLAHVFVRVSGVSHDARLSGFVQGPTCRYSQTLPSRILLRDLGPGEDRLLQAAIPDPCFWSPTLPFLYDVELKVETAADEPVVVRQPFGIRMFGASGRSLRMEGNRWVARGTSGALPLVGRDHDAENAGAISARIQALHEESLVAMVSAPSLAICREASEAGVMLFVRLTTDGPAIEQQVTELARWPAVSTIVLSASSGNQLSGRIAALRQRFPNLLFAAAIGSSEHEPGEIAAAWADVLVWQVPELFPDGSEPEWLSKAIADASRPVLASRSGLAVTAQHAAVDADSAFAGELAVVAQEARAACDRLQADLATFGDFAGYFVKRSLTEDSRQ